MEVCIRRAKPGDEETLAMIQIKSWQSAFADILDRETLEGCTDFERVTATYRRLLEQGIGEGESSLQMEGNQKRSAWLIVAFLGIVLLIYYFNDLVGLLLNRYYSPYWSCNSVWAITQMYAETPCVSKVRFEQVDGGKGGIEKSILPA